MYRRPWHGPAVDYSVGRSSFAAKAAANVRNMDVAPFSAAGEKHNLVRDPWLMSEQRE